MQPMEYSKISYMAKQFKISKLAAVRMRVRYLMDIADCSCDDEICQRTGREALEEALKLMSQYTVVPVKSNNNISDDDINQAKNFPIENIIEFDRSGKAYAFCHEDKSPSLTWYKKGNKARCFPCDKSFNAIDVLMERDNLTFVEAVKKLC